MREAIYAISADPLTYGHIDIIERAARIFDRLVIGIGINETKNYTFSMDERVDMAQKSLQKYGNVEVLPFRGLLVNFAYEQNIPTVVRGARNSLDYEYENLLFQIGDTQKLSIDTIIFPTNPKTTHISSSAAKALQKEQGMVHEYVPPYVKQCLEERISGQYIIGITGDVAAGKSYVGERFEDLGRNAGIPTHNIDLDVIAHQILGTRPEPAYRQIRERIATEFGGHLMQPNSRIDRQALGEIVFADLKKLQVLNRIMYRPMMVRMQEQLYGKKGLMMINAALLAEANSFHLCNNNVVLVTTDRNSQQRRMNERGWGWEKKKRRLNSQYSPEEKEMKINKVIEKDAYGKLWKVDNSDNADPENITKTFADIIEYMGVKV